MSQPLTVTGVQAPRLALSIGGLALLALLVMPFMTLLPADHPLAVSTYTLTLAQDLCYAVVAVALDLVWGLCRAAVARPRAVLRARRLRHGHVPDAAGGGRRAAGVMAFLSRMSCRGSGAAPSISHGRCADRAGAGPAGLLFGYFAFARKSKGCISRS